MELPKDHLFYGNYKWLRQIRAWHIFLPNMEWSYPLSYLQATSIPWKMEWHLTKPQDGVLLEGFGTTSAFSTNTCRQVTGLLLGSLKKKYPIGETLRISSTFLNFFATVHGEFPCQEFRPLGWIHCLEKAWWFILTAFILNKFESQLKRIGRYHAIRAVKYGIPPSHFHFFLIFWNFITYKWVPFLTLLVK